MSTTTRPQEPSNAAPPGAAGTHAALAWHYFENSKLHGATAHLLAERVAQFSDHAGLARQAGTSEKTYPGATLVKLPRGRDVPRASMRLDEALAARRSARAYATRPVELADLAAVLVRGGGLTGCLHHASGEDLTQPVRAAPSGGALYPIETYVAAFEVNGLPPGLYHAHFQDQCLEEVMPGNLKATLAEHLVAGQQQLDAPCLLVLSARWEMPLRKYGERGLRVVLLDAGHLAQNYLLCATARGLAACPIAGFDDDGLSRAMQLDPATEPVVYAITLGYGSEN